MPVQSNGDDHMWEDIMSTLRNAMGDIERIKDQITSNIDIDLRPRIERVRSAFNCQEPGSATLSAEQIVVEHAFEQVKSSLDCSNPDTSNLRSHEEVIERNPVPQDDADIQESDREEPLEAAPEQCESTPAQPAVDLLDLSAKAQEAVVVEQTPPTDLLDIPLDDDEEAVADQAPVAAQPLVDLMDLPVEEIPLSQTATAEPAQAAMDLLDIAAAPAKAVSDEGDVITAAPQKQLPEPENLLDMSDMPVDKVTAEVSSQEYASLLQLSQSLVVPEVKQPSGQATPCQNAPEPVDLL